MIVPFDQLKLLAPAPCVQEFDADDTILYALSVGLGDVVADSRQLGFVYEKGLLALPTMGLVLGDSGFWLQDPATGINRAQVLYGEVSIDLHAPLPCSGEVIGITCLDGLVDKGTARGAYLYTTREVTERHTGQRLCTVKSTYICRADGGCGIAVGTADGSNPGIESPDRPADHRVTLTTRPESALLYRLTGDRNPLHAEPQVARSAGFPRPLLHGLCTFGVAGHALLRALCSYEIERVQGMSARFVAPVFPGDTLSTEIWRDGSGRAYFRSSVPERGQVVLDHGRFRYA